MARKLWARESAGLLLNIALKDSSGAAVDMTGWTLKASFERQAGVVDLTLNTVGSAALEGFYLSNAAAGQYQVRINPASLSSIADDTGDFTMIGDIIATLPSGAGKLWIEDWALQVTEGPTT